VTAVHFVGLGTMGSALSVGLRARGAARAGAKLAAVLIIDGIRADWRW
jgi:pyrroline-5-carboxylate reductase